MKVCLSSFPDGWCLPLRETDGRASPLTKAESGLGIRIQGPFTELAP